MVGRENLKVLVLGATGSIGSAVVGALLKRNHRVTGLARSAGAEQAIATKGAEVLRGDIREPKLWIEAVRDFDAVAHCAITWTDDMDAVDRNLTAHLLKALSTPDAGKSLVYTSGCWGYGATGNLVATEKTPLVSFPEFDEHMALAEEVRMSKQLRGMVIHPAMVWDRDGGTLSHMIEDARSRGQIRVVGTIHTRWTMVHAEDIVSLYALMIERGEAGSVYNGSGTEGIEVYKVAETLAARFGNAQPPELITEEEAEDFIGSWASGYALDQQMSSAKAMHELGWQPKFADVLAAIS
ncbi:MAG: NAD-dependent epimerase/dehydratase family protein [Pseudomonadota bacterium]